MKEKCPTPLRITQTVDTRTCVDRCILHKPPTHSITITYAKDDDAKSNKTTTYAVINCPKIDRKTVLFIHCFAVNPACIDEADEVWRWIIQYARRYRFSKIYANPYKTDVAYLQSKGFCEYDLAFLMRDVKHASV